jgi:hypothetical protein
MLKRLNLQTVSRAGVDKWAQPYNLCLEYEDTSRIQVMMSDICRYIYTCPKEIRLIVDSGFSGGSLTGLLLSQSAM